jgi:toxin secretion/phage lysis holin
MEKLFNTFCILSGFVGGLISNLIGGWDTLINTLILMMLFDYITGILKGYFLKNLDSKIGFWGIIKKFIILIIVSTSHIVSNLVNPTLPFREFVIMFFISNESISVLENAAVFVPIPEQLKKALQQLRNNNQG